MSAITLLPTLCCFFLTPFFLSKFSSQFSLFFLFPYGDVMFTLAFLSYCFVPLVIVFPVHGGGPFYIACREGFSLFYPLIAFF